MAPMDPVAVPERLMTSVRALGPVGSRWLQELPDILASLAADWSIAYGHPLDGGNTAYLIEAVTADGRLVIAKLALPAGVDGFAPFEQELETLRLAGGDPYAELIRHDLSRRSLLLERLGQPLASLGWPPALQLATVASTVARGWRPVRLADCRRERRRLSGWPASWPKNGRTSADPARRQPPKRPSGTPPSELPPLTQSERCSSTATLMPATSW